VLLACAGLAVVGAVLAAFLLPAHGNAVSTPDAPARSDGIRVGRPATRAQDARELTDELSRSA
jgi:hypothetical protein